MIPLLKKWTNLDQIIPHTCSLFCYKAILFFLFFFLKQFSQRYSEHWWNETLVVWVLQPVFTQGGDEQTRLASFLRRGHLVSAEDEALCVFLRAFSQLLWTLRKTSKPLGFSVTVHKKNMLCSSLWRTFAETHLKNMLRIIYLPSFSLTAAHSDCTSADFSRKPDLSSPGVPHVMLCDWFSLLALQPELGSLLRALHAYHAIPTCASGCHCLTSFNPAAWPLLFSWATKTTRQFASAQHRQWQLVNRDLEAPFSL